MSDKSKTRIERGNAPRTSKPGMEEYLRAKGDEPELFKMLGRTGQLCRVRKALLESGDYSLEAIAAMTDEEACRALQIGYSFVGFAGEGHDNIILVSRARLDEFKKMAKFISR